SGQLTMPVVMMSGHATIETAVEATRIGALDFLEKPVALQRLVATVKRALRSPEAAAAPQLALSALGRSPALADAKKRLAQLAQAAAPLLLRGERGMPVWRGAPRRAAFRASRQGDRRDPVLPRPRPAGARRAAQPRVPPDARREAQGAAGVVFAARRKDPGGEARVRSRPRGAALRAHAAPAGVARIRRGCARPRLAHARAGGGGARLSTAAPLDRRAQRAAPPRLARQPDRARGRGEGSGAQLARRGDPAR